MIAARQIAFGKAAGKKEEPPAYWGLCFTAEEAGSTVAMTTRTLSTGGKAPNVTLETSYDGKTWEPFYVNDTVVTLHDVGDRVYFRAGEAGNKRLAAIPGFSSSVPSSNYFVLTGLISASGSINSLLNGLEETVSLNTYAFAYLFLRCSSLTTAPELPAEVFSNGCYRGLFYGCNSLRGEIYIQAGGSVATYSCINMFTNCSSLNRIKVRFTTGLNSNANGANTKDWLKGAATEGTFICPTELGTNETIQRGVYACPEGWTVINED